MLGTALRYSQLKTQYLILNECRSKEYGEQDEAWAAGGSGILLKTTNSGKTWIRDKAADNIAANLYSVKWALPLIFFYV